jgi:hypothetical protein
MSRPDDDEARTDAAAGGATTNGAAANGAAADGAAGAEEASGENDERGDSGGENQNSEPKRSPRKLLSALGRIFAFTRPYRRRLYGALVLTAAASGSCRWACAR